MQVLQWPIERMAEVLEAELSRPKPESYVLRLERPELGVKLMLDIDHEYGDVRLVVDRLVNKRPRFMGSLNLETAYKVEFEEVDQEVLITFANGQRLAIRNTGSWYLYRPS